MQLFSKEIIMGIWCVMYSEGWREGGRKREREGEGGGGRLTHYTYYGYQPWRVHDLL